MKVYEITEMKSFALKLIAAGLTTVVLPWTGFAQESDSSSSDLQRAFAEVYQLNSSSDDESPAASDVHDAPRIAAIQLLDAPTTNQGEINQGGGAYSEPPALDSDPQLPFQVETMPVPVVPAVADADTVKAVPAQQPVIEMASSVTPPPVIMPSSAKMW